MKKTLITGIYGQDGSFLCEFLMRKGYEVHGIIRQKLSENSKRIQRILQNNGVQPIEHIVDLNDYDALKNLIIEIQPDEIYHVAAFHVSSENKNGSNDYAQKQLFDYNVKSTSNILSICYDYLKNCRIITAGSCLMFDNSNTVEQDENTPYNSKSLYGLAKIAENSLVKYYRTKGLYCATAILYNHESERRSSGFVTKKIVENMVKLKKGLISNFTLGNLDSSKDWGYAKDYANGMYLMSQQDSPNDYILSTGIIHTIKDFIEVCAQKLEIANWEKYIEIDKNLVNRKIDTILKGNSTLAKKNIGFKHSVTFDELVSKMIDYDIINL